MVLTQNQAVVALTHVVNNVLARANDTPLAQSLAHHQVTEIYDIITLTPDVIDALDYLDANGNPLPIPLGDQNLLKLFITYYATRLHSNNPIPDTVEGWNNLTRDDFTQWRAQNLNAPAQAPPAQAAPAPAQANTQRRFTPVEIFRRGIKRDPSLFPTLKDERNKDNWHRQMLNQARAQDVQDVLDHAYTPTTPEETELFQEKQKFVYAVLDKMVKTDRGRAIVREHELDFDAQKVYQKLTDYHNKSTKAKIESADLLSYITSARIGDGTWKGTSENFILNWQDQVRKYEKQVPPTEGFSGTQKRTMLENAVHPIQELRQVKVTMDLERALKGTDLTYEQYSDVLISAAAAYDKKFATKTTRKVYEHDLSEVVDAVSDITYDIDVSPSELLEVYNTSRQPTSNQVFMPKDRWLKLSDSAKKIWDQLDNSSKSTILGLSSDKPRPKTFNSVSRPPVKAQPPSFCRHINLHNISAHDYLDAMSHEQDLIQDDETEFFEPITIDEPSDEPLQDSVDSVSTVLVNAAKSKLKPNDIRRILSPPQSKDEPPNSDSHKNQSRQVNTHIVYRVSSATTKSKDSLVDRGANGGVAGTDVRIIHQAPSTRSVDIQGIDNHQLTDICVGTVGGVVDTQHGSAIAIMHNYALFQKGQTIHSPGQLEWYKNFVDDKSVKVGGKQLILTPHGYAIPLVIQNGLPRLPIRPYTDTEWDSLPHIILTDELEWNPQVLDHNHDSDWFDLTDEQTNNPLSDLFNEIGEYRHRVKVQCNELTDVSNDKDEDEDHHPTVPPTPPRVTTQRIPDFNLLRPYFGWFSTDTVKETFAHTTQYGRLPQGTTLQRAYKSPHPALNVSRRNEPVACDIFYSDVPAIFNGATTAVIFVGCDTHVTDVLSIKTDSQFVNALEDIIRKWGAPNMLISDRASVEIGKKVLDILRTLVISNWQSEPYQQNQNYAENRFQTLQRAGNRVMDRTGAPPETWLLALQYVCYLLNHTYSHTLKAVPLQLLYGFTIDISVLLRFYFWQKVYYAKYETPFPSQSKEGTGHFVGFSENVGHALCYQILTSDTKHIIHRSSVRPYDPSDPNVKADLVAGEGISPSYEEAEEVIKSHLNTSSVADDSEPTTLPSDSPVFDPNDLVGRTFLMDEQEDGQRHRARIVKLVEDHEDNVKDNPTLIKFVCSVNDDQYEEIITYNQMLDYILRPENDCDYVWKYKQIVGHEGPLKPTDKNYKGSKWNVLVQWETDEVTPEPLTVIAADDPVTCAIYAKEKGLLDLPGWKRFKSIAKRQKKFTRMVNQAKLRSYNTAPKFKYGYEVARNYKHALELDAKNQNTKWHDSIELELAQIDEYNTFEDRGHKSIATAPRDHKRIRVHLVFDVKHDGRHKARLVADGHLTDVPLESVYSGVVSL